MTYRFPIVKGDRVAIAPHHDLWMAGCRFGTVTSAGGEGQMGGRFYFVNLDTGRNVTISEGDLLGAVGPVGGTTGRIRRWDNDVQPVNPDHHGDYVGEGATSSIEPIEAVTYRVDLTGSTPNGEDVTIRYYTGPSHAQALAALVSAGSCNDDSEGVPHSVRFLNKSVTLTFVRGA